MNQKSLENAKHSNYLIRKYGSYQIIPSGVLLQLKLAPEYRDRFRVVILKLNSKEYIDGVLKSKVNFEFLVNLFVSENDRIH